VELLKGVENIGTRIINIEGKRFGKLVVQKLVPIENNKKFKNGWLCKCDCGGEKICQLDALINGFNKSCGECTNNTYEFHEDYVVGYDKNNESFQFDNEAFDIVSKYSWNVDKKTQAVTTNININNSRKKLLLHKLITNTDKNQVIDHIDGNQRNNLKSNLRNATNQENSCNLKLSKNNTSGITGVWYDKSRDKWVAEIICYQNKISKRCNSFINAVIQRVKWEFEYFREFRSDRNDHHINNVLNKYNLSIEIISKGV